MATAKGHMDKRQINVKSTKLNQQELIEEIQDMNPPQEKQSYDMFVASGVTDGKVASGNKYILIGYDYDSNAIITKP
eukprot:1742951-Ditylum_brightwellii.AAC.1